MNERVQLHELLSPIRSVRPGVAFAKMEKEHRDDFSLLYASKAKRFHEDPQKGTSPHGLPHSYIPTHACVQCGPLELFVGAHGGTEIITRFD